MSSAAHSISKLLRASALIAALLAAYGSAEAGRLYRWVDDQGQVRYGDQIPPQYAKQRQDTLNPQGVVIETKAAAKTPEQIAEEQRAAEAAAEEEHARQERAQHDRMLVSTFTSEDDLVMTRDGKIAAIEAAIRLAEARVEKAQQRLSDLTRTAADIERGGHPVSEEMRQQITDAREKIDQNGDYIKNRQAEQEDIRRQFELDLARFRELKAQEKEMDDQAAGQAPASSGTDQSTHALVGK